MAAGNEELSERFTVAERAVPDRLLRAAVAIVRGGSTGSGHGSGTLLRIADCSFVVTARHVIRDAYAKGWPLGITGDTHIIDTPGNWVGSPQTGNQPDRGWGDIAIYKLNEQQVSHLRTREFVRLSDLGLSADLTKGYYHFLGFPVMLTDQATKPEEPLNIGTFNYSTSAAKNPGGLADFDEKVHFLLAAKEETLVNQEGESTSLRTRHGTRVNLVDGVAGISGSGVWRIGRPDVRVEEWRHEDAKIVGVATGVYPAAQVIKVTKWAFVMKLIHASFPEVRPVLELVTNQPR